MMMIGGGVATPPGTAKSAAAIDSEMVQVDGIGSGSVSGSASGSGSPATGATTTRLTNSGNAAGNANNNNNNGDVANNNNNNNDGHGVVNCASGPAAATEKFCCHDDDAPVSAGVTRPWEPPSPTFSQTRPHLLQVHPSHHHQHPAAHHHQQMTVPPVSLIDGQFATTLAPFLSLPFLVQVADNLFYCTTLSSGPSGASFSSSSFAICIRNPPVRPSPSPLRGNNADRK